MATAKAPIQTWLNEDNFDMSLTSNTKAHVHLFNYHKKGSNWAVAPLSTTRSPTLECNKLKPNFQPITFVMRERKGKKSHRSSDAVKKLLNEERKELI